VELLTGETNEARFEYDPLKKGLHTAPSDHRENFYGPSSRLKLQNSDAVEKQKAAALVYAKHKEEEKKKAAAEEKAAVEKADRAEARKMLLAEQKRQRAEAAAEAADRAAIGLEFALKIEAREATLAKSRVVQEEEEEEVLVDENGKALKHVRKPFKPNSGRLIFDDQRWTFIPNGVSLPGPPNFNDEKAKALEKKKAKAKAMAMKKK